MDEQNLEQERKTRMENKQNSPQEQVTATGEEQESAAESARVSEPAAQQAVPVQQNAAPSPQKTYSKKSIVLAVVITVLVMVVIVVSIYCMSLAKRLKEATTVTTGTTVTTTAATTKATTKKPKQTTTAAPTTKAALQGITDATLKNYNVIDPEGGGFQGLIMDYTCEDDCDGYQVRVTFNYGTDSETSRDIDVKASCKRVYCGTQSDVPMVQIRSYRNTNGDRTYSDWWQLCNWKLANWADKSEIYTSDWDTLVQNAANVDIY